MRLGRTDARVVLPLLAVASIGWLTACSAAPSAAAGLALAPGLPPIPEVVVWQRTMTQLGRFYCSQRSIHQDFHPLTEASVWYYDGTLVYHNIAKYTGDDSWLRCADWVNAEYRQWVLTSRERPPFDGRSIGGWRVFPDGLQAHFLRTGDETSRAAAIHLAIGSAMLNDWDGWTVRNASRDTHCELSREVAYVIDAFVVAGELGAPQEARLRLAVSWALGHLEGWFVSGSCTYMQPFMVGLTTEALLFVYERTDDAALRTRIRDLVETSMDQLWERAWLPRDRAFYYESTDPRSSASTLNLLIAPTYAWLWQVTGRDRHQERGDQVFAGGVLRPDIHSGKQFSQNYRRSFDYLKWRSSPPGSLVPPTRY